MLPKFQSKKKLNNNHNYRVRNCAFLVATATSYFAAIGISHFKITLTLISSQSNYKWNLHILSGQQLTFHRRCLCNKVERDFLYNCHNRTAYDRSESCRIIAISHYICIAGAQANHVREIQHVCGLVWATWQYSMHLNRVVRV